MPLDYDMLMSLPPWEVKAAHTKRDTILYALGVGAGHVQDDAALRYTYEEGLKALPTMAVVLAHPGLWQRDPKLKLDWRRMLHGEQWLELYQPLPTEGLLRSIVRIEAIHDKGPDKGALLYWSRQLFEERTGIHLATIGQSSFLRGDGGFGGPTNGAPKLRERPSTRPDMTVDCPTRAEQALIYRLSGDYNPIHADPKVALEAGFNRPILHGLCTYGVVGHALLRCVGQNDPHALRKLNARFTNPVFPGETIRTDIWRHGDGCASFRSTVIERGVIVLDYGYAEFN